MACGDFLSVTALWNGLWGFSVCHGFVEWLGGIFCLSRLCGMACGDFLSVTALWNGLGGFSVTALWNGLGGFSASSWNGLWGFSVSLFLCEFLCLLRLRGVACGDFLSLSLWDFLCLSRLRGVACGDVLCLDLCGNFCLCLCGIFCHGFVEWVVGIFYGVEACFDPFLFLPGLHCLH